jgi:propionyl-CoA carboxylase alpha chain
VVQSSQGEISLTLLGNDRQFEVRFDDGEGFDFEFGWQLGQSLGHFIINGELKTVKIDRQGSAWRLRSGGTDLKMHVRRPRVAELSLHMKERQPPDLSRFLLCPMPGIVTRLNVSEGESIEAGQALATVEAMKMENVLRAERRGKVASIKVAEGQSLSIDEIIMEFA